MTDQWDFYFCKVDDHPASIYVDLGIAEQMPLARYPMVGYLRLAMCTPRADGLSSNAEYAALTAIEDALEAMVKRTDAVYVGRCTSAGYRDFYFYMARGIDWEAICPEQMATFPDYRFELGLREDSDWSSYQSFLYPGGAGREQIENRKVCDLLVKHGDDLLTSREIAHWAYFSDASQRDQFVAQAVTLGFSVRSTPSSDEEDTYPAQLWRSDIPSQPGIDQVTQSLRELAAQFGGDYDGWESEIVRPSDGEQSS